MFHDHRLPLNFMRGAEGGLGFKTTKLESDAGLDQRNIEWSQCRGEWDLRGHFMWIDDPVTFSNDVRELRNFFTPKEGMAHTFRVRDEVDYNLGDWQDPTNDNENIGVGDASQTEFQSTLTYTKDGFSYARDIHGIVTGRYTVLIDDIAQTEGGGADYTINQLTGLITFNAAPAMSTIVQIAAEFDVICYAGFDRLNITLDMVSQKSLIPSLLIIEEKDPEP